MEITVTVNRPLKDTGYTLCSGSITIIGSKIVKFTQSKEQISKQSVSDIKDIEIVKSKEATYEIEFINKYDEYYSQNNAKIQIKNGSSFYIHLNLFQRAKLKWMLEGYLIQSKEMKIDLFKFVLGTIFGIVSTLTTQEVAQVTIKEPVTPPTAGIQKSLEHKNLKNINK